MDLSDRSAIITGANQGLGKAIATEFVKAGAGVLLVARDEGLLRQVRDELRPLAPPGRRVEIIRADVSKPEDLRDAKVDVNAIAPGALNTRLLDEVLEAGPQKVGQQFYERSLKQQKEGGAPVEKGARLAVFLASSASDGITGRLISAVWDDWQNLPARRAELSKGDVYTLRRIVPEDRGMK